MNSAALIQRASGMPSNSMVGFHHWSCPLAVTVYGVELTTRSGWPSVLSSSHSDAGGQSIGGGRSAGLPSGAPASTHRTTVSISASVSEKSFLNAWMPTVRSMCQGGMMRRSTRSRICRTHGRTSS